MRGNYFSDYRREILSGVKGKVLEIGDGTESFKGG